MLSYQMVEAQCNATFTQTGVDPTFTFTPTNTPAATSNYHWNFGDGSYSSTLSPSHTYTLNGTFTVTFTISDPILMCQNSYTSTVTVSSISQTCDASFAYSDSNGVYTFIPTSPFARATYAWDFGDGTTSTLQYPTHQFNPTGTNMFNVCLIISDSAGGCSDTSCVTINITPSPICDAYFSFVLNNLTANFTASSPTVGATYSWSFGDGTTSTLQNPTHTYTNNTGNPNRTVCLTITDSAGTCTDTECSIVVLPFTNNAISGFITMGNNSADSGVVFLIEYDSTLGTLLNGRSLFRIIFKLHI